VKAWVRILAAGTSLTWPTASWASSINTMQLSDGTPVIVITGDIEIGDETKFEQFARKYSSAVVALDSSGGRLAPALDIGRSIRIKGYSTAVVSGSICASSCALMWLAGTPRFKSESAKIGFHASYREENGTARETGLGNALIGRYLTLLNLSERAVIFATIAAPDEISWITPENTAISGIDFEVLKSVLASAANPKVATVSPETTNTPANAPIDPSFRRLFQSWKRLDQLQTGVVAIPNLRPTDTLSFGRAFGGKHSEVGNGRHPGVDISGRPSSPIYATAEGLVAQVGQSSGYGLRVVLEHGRGIQTLYGNLGSALVGAGDRIKRGQLIGRMTSSNQRADNYLHYEVRLEGKAVNPMPFLQSSDFFKP
jgi:murein DD-endopeptidase MepM/ murein hydrolase activator NlpD